MHQSSAGHLFASTVLPLLCETCFSQKHATELFSNPTSPRWSASLASAGSLTTGEVCLNTLAATVKNEVVVRRNFGDTAIEILKVWNSVRIHYNTRILANTSPSLVPGPSAEGHRCRLLA